MRISAVCVLLALAFALTAAAPAREVRRSVPLEPNGRVYVDTYKGSLEIAGWDKAEVEIYARIESEPALFGDTARCVERTRVRIDAWPDSLRIRSDYGDLREGGGLLGELFNACSSLPLVHYRIHVPRSAELRVRDTKSRIEISDVRGGTQVNTYRGTLNGRRLGGRLDLETYRGEIEVELLDLERGARFATTRGEIAISVPRNTRFDLVSNLGRRARLDSSFSARGRAVNGGGPPLRIKSDRGTIRLRTS